MSDNYKRTSWFLRPFKVIWTLLETIIRLAGRLAAAILGLTIMIAGFILTIIIIAALVGIPLMVFGFLLMIRGIF
jgi:uncharacterized membrane protein (DUF106 family)